MDAPYEPEPDEIARLTAQIRAEWSENREYHRTVGWHPRDGVDLPVYPDLIGTGDVREYPQLPAHRRRRSEQ